MSTNPGSSIGTNAAYGGRTSVKAFNDSLAMLPSRGILSGWGCAPVSGMTVQLGGDEINRDVAIAEDAVGNRISINNRSEMPIEVTLAEAAEGGARVDLIVAYVVDPPTSSGTYADNPDACGLIVVSGTTSSSPEAPDDGAIRTAITLDGESGETAYYVVLASVLVGSGATMITADDITGGEKVGIQDITADSSFSTTSNKPVANKVVTAAVVGETETYIIPTSRWTNRSDLGAFKYAANVSVAHQITSGTIVELINDNAVSFAEYGFSVGSVSGQMVAIYAVKPPEVSVTLKINYKEVA